MQKVNGCEVTEWFPGNTRPSHSGVYQRESNGMVMFAKFFKLRGWYLGHNSVAAAFKESTLSAQQRRPWRGCTQDHRVIPKDNASPEYLEDEISC